jgi:hypothetical protein
MNNAPKSNTGDSDLSRWAKGVQSDSNQNQPLSHPDFNTSATNNGTSLELNRKFKREWPGFYIPQKGVNYDATGSYEMNEVAQVQTGVTYRNHAGATVPADVGVYVCLKSIPPEDSTYIQTIAAILTNVDYTALMRTGSGIYYPQSTGNSYWLPLGGGGTATTGGDVWL